MEAQGGGSGWRLRVGVGHLKGGKIYQLATWLKGHSEGEGMHPLLHLKLGFARMLLEAKLSSNYCTVPWILWPVNSPSPRAQLARGQGLLRTWAIITP